MWAPNTFGDKYMSCLKKYYLKDAVKKTFDTLY